MPRYIKCPRCELNYIEEDKELCEVCLAERQGRHLRFADIDEFDVDDVEKTKLCPICGENYIYPNEKYCEDCKDKSNLAEDDDIEPEDEQDDEWRKYLDEDIRDLPIADGMEEELDESMDEEFEDDLLEEEIDEFDDDIDDLADDDVAYEDDDEEDEEDFEDDF